MSVRSWVTVIVAVGFPILQAIGAEQQRVYIDPGSGKLIDAPPADSSLTPEVARQTGGEEAPVEPLREVVKEDGSATMDLRGRFRMELKMRQTQSGSYEIRHESAR